MSDKTRHLPNCLFSCMLEYILENPSTFFALISCLICAVSIRTIIPLLVAATYIWSNLLLMVYFLELLGQFGISLGCVLFLLLVAVLFVLVLLL